MLSNNEDCKQLFVLNQEKSVNPIKPIVLSNYRKYYLYEICFDIGDQKQIFTFVTNALAEIKPWKYLSFIGLTPDQRDSAATGRVCDLWSLLLLLDLMNDFSIDVKPKRKKNKPNLWLFNFYFFLINLFVFIVNMQFANLLIDTCSIVFVFPLITTRWFWFTTTGCFYLVSINKWNHEKWSH